MPKRSQSKSPSGGRPSSGPIAYLGPAGTFSHLLARKRFPQNDALVGQANVAAIFEFLAESTNHRAIVPVENSSGGTIYGTVDLLIESAGSIFVTESLSLDIRMALIGQADQPIRRIYSHYVQLHNHRDWLRESYPKAEVIPVESTALAAQLASKKASYAALTAPSAADIYGLEVLASPRHQPHGNVTHFFVLARSEQVPRNPEAARTAVAVSFGNEPGSLFRFLEPFANANLNINRIISRPHPGRSDRVMFFMEIDGSPGLASYDTVLPLAASRCDVFHLFGSYPHQKKFRS